MNDAFDWQRDKSIDEEQVLTIIQAKEKKSELTGLVMTREDSKIGCSLLYHKTGTISFGLDINRKLYSNKHRFTDINWYIDHLVSPLIAQQITIVSIKWDEHI